MNMYQEINSMLSAGSPQLSLMFHGRKNQYLIRRVAGFIHVPYNFTPKQLKDYVEENANEARHHAKEFVKSQQVKSRIDQVLQRSWGKL